MLLFMFHLVFTLVSMSISKERITSIIDNVALQCNFTEWKFSERKFDNIAQNFFGVLIPLNLTGMMMGQEREVSIPIVLKLAPTDERYRVSGAITLMFAREIYVYSILLRRYSELQQSLTSAYFIIPKCYYVCQEYLKEAIAMQDMTYENYKPFSVGMFLDFTHITISLKALAKFHALSFILREKDATLYEETSKVCSPLTEKANGRFMDVMTDRLTKALQKFKDTIYASWLEYLKQNCVRLIEAIAGSVNTLCICHGDIWKENILFQYKENQPVSACLIDYQTVRMCSPAFDTLFLIISSTDAELRHKHFYNFLDIYYQKFDETLKDAGLDSQVLYTRQSFDNDLKVVAPACFIVVNTAFWLLSGLQEEGHVRSKITWNTEEEKMEAIENYKTIIKHIIDDFRTYKYLCTCF